MPQTTHLPRTEQPPRLADFIGTHQPLFVLTGAGCSTDSGIPDYRDEQGNWKFSRPVQFDHFMRQELVRKRYWARSMAGWPGFFRARPNAAHTALARLETAGFIHQLVTQNVDGLHQKAGSAMVLDLHGRLDTVICMECNTSMSRQHLQEAMVERNGQFIPVPGAIAPDGDSALENADLSAFHVPGCPECNGILKPDVVFFGEQVPKKRVTDAMLGLEQSAGILVIGSSLMVFSGYRFCKIARSLDKPMAAVNLGYTRADAEFDLKISQPCGDILSAAAAQLIA